MIERTHNKRPVKWADVKQGDEVWLAGTHEGEPCAYGPHTVVDPEDKFLESPKGYTFFHCPEELVVDCDDDDVVRSPTPWRLDVIRHFACGENVIRDDEGALVYTDSRSRGVPNVRDLELIVESVNLVARLKAKMGGSAPPEEKARRLFREMMNFRARERE